MARNQGKAFSDAFNLLPKDPDDNIKLPSLEVTAKKLGISLTSQETNDELVCADADTPGKNDSDSFDSVDARGILLLKVFLKLAELAALPRRTLFRIISYYQQKLRDCNGQKVRVDGDSLKRRRKKPQKTSERASVPYACLCKRCPRLSQEQKGDSSLHGAPQRQLLSSPLLTAESRDTPLTSTPSAQTHHVIRQLTARARHKHNRPSGRGTARPSASAAAR
ncbi:EF-hand calcium-binding domain-containing protein 3 isoform X4 [Balearica regulorum gibbericeps]|uniref:EF-hand calcium-binding domain-containing protein 3 isoform X4 n=1 Tax=Balearica regulorum gibbericeps TaxID=100784 RepID=UPI003F60DB6F